MDANAHDEDDIALRESSAMPTTSLDLEAGYRALLMIT